MQRKKRKVFWRNFRFKYKVSIINENTLEEVFGIHISKLNGLSVVLVSAFVIFAISSCIIIFTPLRFYLPGYVNSELRSQIVANSIATDTLFEKIRKQDAYINNVKSILGGNIAIDSVTTLDTFPPNKQDTLLTASEKEIIFRKQYEEAEKYNLTNTEAIKSGLSGVNFIRPTRGIIISQFKPTELHFGVDISADENENVLSVLDGTVIFSNYTAQWEYVVAIQHANGIISMYKHCDAPFKQIGEKVRSGEAIALTNKKSKHIHFELWFNGQAIDPKKYIAF